MELGTTSAVITFAIELEEKAQTCYSQAQKATVDTQILEVLQRFQKHYSKRIKRLQRFRRELVTEMILEPIHGFNREEFEHIHQIPSKAEAPEILLALLANEENLKKYFETASKKLEFLPELSDQFHLLAEDIENNIQTLKNLY